MKGSQSIAQLRRYELIDPQWRTDTPHDAPGVYLRLLMGLGYPRPRKSRNRSRVATAVVLEIKQRRGG